MYLHSLGYLGVRTPHADEWPAFAAEIFGLEVQARESADRPTHIRWDDRPFRLAVHSGDTDTVEYLGWETPHPQAFRGIIEHARGLGYEVHPGSEQECSTRMVRELAWAKDPFGIRHEFFYGPMSLDRSFRGGRQTSGFATGIQGLGHAVLVVPSHAQALPFYERVLGLRCSDIVGLGDLGTMMFLRCNSRHHSVALWEQPGKLGLQHIMIESRDLNDVGKAYDLVQKSQYKISATMGRHTGDEQLSFYTRTPSGFDLEYGCDSIDIVEEEWTVRYFDPRAGAPNEIWGHHWEALTPQSSVHDWMEPESVGSIRNLRSENETG